jgi:AhpC/TSA family
MSLLTIGHQFPAYRLTALIGGDLSKVDAQQPGDYFTTISSDDHPGKWRVVFFWPKDFTFVCPTEIATFGKLNDEFEDREAQILGSRSTANSCTSSGVHSTRTSSGCPSRCSRTSSGSSPSQRSAHPTGRGGTRAHRVRGAGVHALRPNGWSRPSQSCANAVALPENDWLH